MEKRLHDTIPGWRSGAKANAKYRLSYTISDRVFWPIRQLFVCANNDASKEQSGKKTGVAILSSTSEPAAEQKRFYRLVSHLG
jgi:hypothetical protein